MRAAVLTAATGEPEAAEFPDPAPADGREIVSLVAAGIHPVVRSLATGAHYGSAGGYPLIPGVDAVARTADGQVIYTGYAEPPYGTLAERISVPAGMRLELPAGADPHTIAAGMNPGMSSWLPLRSRRAETGELGTVLVLGATGSAGRLAVQNAFELGASRVVAAGRDRAALQRIAATGAEPVALVGSPEDVTAIAAALGDEAPGLVLDYVWGPVAEAALSALARRGLEEDRADISYVEIGASAGDRAAVPASLLRSRRIRITGSGAGSSSLAEIMAGVVEYLDVLASGRVEVSVRAFPLAEVTAAWRSAASDSSVRAVVVHD